MKSPLVVSSTSTNFFISNENSNKENIENFNLIEIHSNTNKLINFANSNSSNEFIETKTQITDNNNNKNNNTDSVNNNDFQKLKRSHAIEDIQAMDDYSPVTYETSITTNADSILEEDKLVIPGIKVRAGKIPKLIHILIQSFDRNGKLMTDTDFPRVFFLMHKWFMESGDLANMLVDLYEKFEKEASDTNKPIALKINAIESQTQINHAIQYWINTFPFHFALDNRLSDVVRSFMNTVHTKQKSEHLKIVDMSNIDNYDWMRKFTTRNPMRSKQHMPLAFNKIEPEVLANQLTYLEWKTLRRISFSDYKSYAIKGSIQDNQPLERSIQLFNGLSQWIQCMVLSKTTPKQRADVIHKFIEVAKHLRQLQNFNGLMAVIGGICHSALARLSKTNVYLSAEDQKVLYDFMELLSSSYNYAQYRKAISEISTFWIPIIGIHLKDMISLHTAHLDKLDNDLINFRKMAQLSVIFQNLTDLQNSMPPVQENRDLIKLLQLSLDMTYSEDEIYELSLAREPRTSVSSPSTPTKFSAFADWTKSVSTPPDLQTIQKHVNAMVDAVFKNYDHDQDGFISHAEFDEIAQNFPFVDKFSVLDADQDGMISRNEMKNYFLRANYHALKSEFKHDFHEATYMKPTFCTHCEGFLWGLIKQGWKCKDCGINAHKHCKDRIVMECRTKRSCISRQASNAGTEVQRKRATFQKRLSNNKQVSTQTETNDDFFLSEESISSNEDQNRNINTLLNSKTESYDTQHESFETNTLASNKLSQSSFDQNPITTCTSHNNNNLSALNTPNTQRNNRLKRYKKFSKRRKSLPSQGSSNEEPHTVTLNLIPRGPLICSNNENNWLPEKFSNNSIINSSMTCDYDTSSILSINNSINCNMKLNSNINRCATNSMLITSNNTSISNLSIGPSMSTISNSILPTKSPGLTIDIPSSSPKTKIITKTKSKNSIPYRNPIPSTVNYDVNIIKTTVYNACNTKAFDSGTSSNRNNKHCSRIDSDFYLNDIFDDYQLDDEIIGTGSYSSNEDDTSDIMLKLEEAEKEREKLANENARIKQQLESANAQINSLKNEMSSIRKDTINFILDQMDSLHFTNKTSEV